MSTNSYKSQKGNSLFGYLEEHKALQGSVFQETSTRYVPQLFFVFALGLLYVFNTHHYERMLRRMAQLELETAALRVEHTTLQASYMFQSKQSEVAKRVATRGLHEVPYPPLKIKAN